MQLRRWGAVGAVSAASLGGLGAFGVVPSGAAGMRSTGVTTTVVARGLDVPKYLSFGPGGLYVAESGRGGRHCVNLVGSTGSPLDACTGATGSIIRINRLGRVRTVVSGLASTNQGGTEIDGPIAVAFDGRRPAALMRGLLPDAAGRSAIPGPLGREFGKLVVATPRRVSTRYRTLADFGAFAERNPQSGATLGGLPGEVPYDTDVHDVVAYRGGWAVADAGANDVLWVHRGGAVSLIARLPTQSETAPAGSLGPGSPAMTIQAQSVPSSLTVGPDGALYVGILRGIPSLPGTAAVYRVVPGQTPTVAVSGLSRVSDVAFSSTGKLLILESNVAGLTTTPTSQGALLSASLPAAGGSGGPVTATDLGVTGLVDPTGLAVGPAGRVYVTNDTGVPGHGEVLRLDGVQ